MTWQRLTARVFGYFGMVLMLSGAALAFVLVVLSCFHTLTHLTRAIAISRLQDTLGTCLCASLFYLAYMAVDWIQRHWNHPQGVEVY